MDTYNQREDDDYQVAAMLALFQLTNSATRNVSTCDLDPNESSIHKSCNVTDESSTPGDTMGAEFLPDAKEPGPEPLGESRSSYMLHVPVRERSWSTEELLQERDRLMLGDFKLGGFDADHSKRAADILLKMCPDSSETVQTKGHEKTPTE